MARHQKVRAKKPRHDVSGPGKVVAVCPNCGSDPVSSERYCTTCQYDLGAPNVRHAYADKAHLQERYGEVRKNARSKGMRNAINNFANTISERSSVVIAVPAAYARRFVDDPRTIYQNYERLVGANIRKPAAFDQDRQRCGVGGVLFGSFADRIQYGCLSLSGDGLATYGQVFLRLRDVAIKSRTSFLEENSFAFVTRHQLTPGRPIPQGYRATWDDRHKLAAAKIAGQLPLQQGVAVWQSLLVVCDDKNRGADEFIEAHIYGSFDVNAVQEIRLAGKMSRRARMDARIAVELFEKLAR